MKQTHVLQQPSLLFTLPSQRQPGWLSYNDKVVFVILDDKGLPRIRTGHICSWPGSHGAGFEIDNISKTIVWCDQVLNDLSDNADDAHEKSFEVKDPRLLKLDEIESLKDPRKAVEWFTGVYSPKVAYQISKLLSKPDFGLHDETMAEVVANRKFQQLCEANQKHWFEHGRPLPVHGRVSAR